MVSTTLMAINQLGNIRFMVSSGGNWLGLNIDTCITPKVNKRKWGRFYTVLYIISLLIGFMQQKTRFQSEFLWLSSNLWAAR